VLSFEFPEPLEAIDFGAPFQDSGVGNTIEFSLFQYYGSILCLCLAHKEPCAVHNVEKCFRICGTLDLMRGVQPHPTMAGDRFVLDKDSMFHGFP
jgi:hypothetical protein